MPISRGSASLRLRVKGFSRHLGTAVMTGAELSDMDVRYERVTVR